MSARFNVGTQTLDALNDFLALETLSREEGMALRVEDDKIVATDIKQEQTHARRDFVSGIRDFVNSGSVLPAHRTVELNRDEREKTIRRIGSAALGSIAVAAEHGSVLCVDDLLTKRVAHER